MFELHEHQREAIAALRESMRRGSRSPLLVKPTGSGKTVVAAHIIMGAVAKGKRCLFLAPRRELVYQTSDKLAALEVPHGILMAGERPSMTSGVQIGCVPTMHRRCFKDGEPVKTSLFGGGYPLPPADLVIVDEAHASFSLMTRKILKEYPQAYIVGMTATPARSDGRGLGELYDDMVMGLSTGELIRMGFLAPVRHFGADPVDLSGVHQRMGDYHEKELSEVMSTAKVIGDVYDNWRMIAGDRQTIVFAVNRSHAKALHNEFDGHGVTCGYVDGTTPNDERAETQRKFESGMYQVLMSVDVFSYGWDCPSASCAVIARPTKSIARFLQMAGRVMRTHPDKKDCILICHGDMIDELGYVDDDQPWSLDGEGKIQDRKEEMKRKEAKKIVCPECKKEVPAARRCQECGHEMGFSKGKEIIAKKADLKERKRDDMITDYEKMKVFQELKGVQGKRGYKEGWAAVQFKEKYGEWPKHRDAPPIEPSPKTLSWVKSRLIRYAKGRANGRRAAEG